MADRKLSKRLLADAPDRLEEATVIWLTTVAADGQPQASVVWHIVDDGEVLVYSRTSPRVRNLEHNSRVALNLDGNGQGGAIVTMEGEARLVPDHPPSRDMPAYMAKYGERMTRMGLTPEGFAATYSNAIRISLTRVRW